MFWSLSCLMMLMMLMALLSIEFERSVVSTGQEMVSVVLVARVVANVSSMEGEEHELGNVKHELYI